MNLRENEKLLTEATFLQGAQVLFTVASMLWAIFLPLLSHCSGVFSQPTLTQPPSESVALGKTVRLSARLSSGYENYVVAWYQQKEGQAPRLLLYRDSNRQSGIPDRFSGSRSGSDRILTITGVQPEDEATYICGADHGSTSAGVFSQPPLTQPPSESAALGKTVRLSARLNSRHTSFAVEWYQQRQGQAPQPLLYADSSRRGGIPDRFSGSRSGSDRILTIMGVQPEDEATYYCGVGDGST
uniref:Uncharacterized protein n=1 Tax=Sphaerodactylus townsendi TaxID=933632 RepID=A0ACB8FZU1_9SAUR